MSDWTKPRTSQDIPYVNKDAIEREIKGNLDYLKTTADTTTTNVATNVTDIATNTAAIAAIDTTSCVMRDGSTVAYASPSGARAKTTVYQNTSGKIRLVTIAAYNAAAGDEIVIHVGAANPPVVHVAAIVSNAADVMMGNATFFVPPSYYYEAKETVATMTISEWTEWDIL